MVGGGGGFRSVWWSLMEVAFSVGGEHSGQWRWWEIGLWRWALWSTTMVGDWAMVGDGVRLCLAMVE
nr:hypothetical protein Iba_scaffold795256CG0010 [Ipomoea batatas]